MPRKPPACYSKKKTGKIPLSAAGWSRKASDGLVGVAKQDGDEA